MSFFPDDAPSLDKLRVLKRTGMSVTCSDTYYVVYFVDVDKTGFQHSASRLERAAEMVLNDVLAHRAGTLAPHSPFVLPPPAPAVNSNE